MESKVITKSSLGRNGPGRCQNQLKGYNELMMFASSGNREEVGVVGAQ